MPGQGQIESPSGHSCIILPANLWMEQIKDPERWSLLHPQRRELDWPPSSGCQSAPYFLEFAVRTPHSTPQPCCSRLWGWLLPRIPAWRWEHHWFWWCQPWTGSHSSTLARKRSSPSSCQPFQVFPAKNNVMVLRISLPPTSKCCLLLTQTVVFQKPTRCDEGLILASRRVRHLP